DGGRRPRDQGRVRRHRQAGGSRRRRRARPAARGLPRRRSAMVHRNPAGRTASLAEVKQMPPIYITFLNRLDIEELALSDEEILAAIETSLAAQGRGQTVIEPRVHLAPGQSNGHFNVLRGAINAPVD